MDVIQVFEIDPTTGVLIGENIVLPNAIDHSIHIATRPTPGLYEAKWNGDSWEENLTPEQIAALTQDTGVKGLDELIAIIRAEQAMDRLKVDMSLLALEKQIQGGA